MPDHTQKTFRGRFSSTVPPYTVPVSTITYDGDLNGNHSVSGVIGATDMNSQLDNGAVLGGELMPPIDHGYNVMGQGTWSTMF
ncbi:hypothetical protein BDV40DRAFT_266315 [Aspergillus tamarii]|uniref:Uncharacterized protein n=1 Tax=Aspergillus tamarii TaxID=41984 RepID=A0A5N6UTG4_ASPTM|nr:hypothetical protein BDV40DRAFT_266315 [Aspergillus tamarii]